MDPELEALTHELLDGRLDEAGRRNLAGRLEADPGALAEFVDQLQVHHQLGALLREDAGGAVAQNVLREIRLLADSERFSGEVVERIKRDVPRPRRWHAWAPFAAAAAILAATFFAIFHEPAPTTFAGRREFQGDVLLVSGRGTPRQTDPHFREPLEADARVRERLERLGFRVSVKSVHEAVPQDAAGKALVLISSTAYVQHAVDPASSVIASFRAARVPLLTWEPRLYYELGMLPAGVHKVDWGTLYANRVTLRRADHPLAGGLSGTVEVTSMPAQVSWGRPGPGALALAMAEGDPAKALVFGYDAGEAMPGLAAPARRVGFFLFDRTALVLTGEGWALFDAAVRWCSGREQR